MLKRTGESVAADRTRAYRETVKHRLSKGVEESVFERLRDGTAVGSEAFCARIRDLAGDVPREVAGKRQLRRRIAFEEVVRCVEQARGQDFATFVNTRGDWGKPMVMWLARRYCGMTLRELGELMGGDGLLRRVRCP